MDYIVFDLEWNQSPYGKRTEVKEIPFEIIEIGAVKLNEKKEVVSSFNRLIKPQIYNEIHSITKEIIHIEISDLLKEESFENVIKDFFAWCGDDYRFATWGNMDLIELQRNLDYYAMDGYIDNPIVFYDVQKLFAMCYYEDRVSRTLEFAVDVVKLDKTEEFHRAYVDAKYTAEIFKMLDHDIVDNYYSIDCFHNPKTKEEEIHLYYETYYKFISREFESKEAIMESKDINGIICHTCNQRIAKKIRWFTTNSKTYYSLGYCKKHGYIKNKIRIKKATNNNVYAVKVVKAVNEEDAGLLMKRYTEAKLRKKEKRLKVI
ncbi:3'-5' exonuclease [Anaerosporobacter sp.]|uniref:3'-5' exonuclease n=1 Tax=Anaerosporobacter sp. TaxID=1872529 RepID=UPI00286F6344|nr:3'-5' exonuclease [Anaerosporobacter sp.]